MKDDPKTKSRGHFVIVACVLVLLPVLYVLSYGPVVWLCYHGYLDADTVRPIYRPIGWLSEECEVFDDAIYWYRALWIS